jgi:putative methanogenesis marker protein 3
LKISIDGLETGIQPGTTIGAAADDLGIKIAKGAIIAVRRPLALEKVQTNLFEIWTTRGKIIVKIECDKVLEGWRRSFKKFEGVKARWVTNDAAVFGPIVTDFEPSNDAVEVNGGEIAISLSGFSNENTHLVLGKKLHKSDYAPPRGCGVVGRIVYNRHLVDKLSMGDSIKKIEPMVETKEMSGAVVKADSSYKILDPVKVYTKVKLELENASPLSGELVHKALNQGFFRVDRRTSVFTACDTVNVASLAKEVQGRRLRGTVTVRCVGHNSGSVYIYMKESALTESHNISGKVIDGMDLVDVSGDGDLLAAEVSPAGLDIVGSTQQQVDELLQKRSLKLVRSGNTSDSAIVVEQEPQTTLEVYKKGEVRCFGIEKSQIVSLRLFEKEAPLSVRYFRRHTGLELRKVGKLSVYFASPKKDIILFKGNDIAAKELLPENMPVGKALANQIGVTNAAKKLAGTIGVRFNDHTEYGPTAEKFEGTNIIGEIAGNADALKGSEKVIYVTEVAFI